jgi:hypothetical protein
MSLCGFQHDAVDPKKKSCTFGCLDLNGGNFMELFEPLMRHFFY